MPHKATDSVTAIRVGVGKANTVRGEFDAFRKLMQCRVWVTHGRRGQPALMSASGH